MATLVTFFESCVSREILGGDRARPWLEVLARVASAGAAGIGGRAGGGTEVAGAAAGRRSPAGCSHGTRGRAGVRGGGAAEPSPPRPHPRFRSPQKPLPLPCFGFPSLKCGHPVACLSRRNGAICQSCLETKAQGTSREWLSLIQMGGGRGFACLRALSC